MKTAPAHTHNEIPGPDGMDRRPRRRDHMWTACEPKRRLYPRIIPLLTWAVLSTAPIALAAEKSVADYGAVANDGLDDSAAFQKALEDIARAGQGHLHVPAGNYHFKRLVSVAIEGGGLTLTGAGQGVTTLYGENTNGVLRIADATCTAQINLRDFSVFAAREGAGTAIEVASPSRGARNYRTLTIENVDIRGAGLPTKNYFDYGVKAIAQWRPIFINVIFSGVMDPALMRDKSDASPLFRARGGFVADWCYAPSFQHCYAWSAQTGYRIVSEGRSHGPEDGAFYRCTANHVRVGIDIYTPGMEPQLVIDACHVNARDVGIRLVKRKFFHITNNLLYGFDHDENTPYTDIALIECQAGVISKNIFHSPAPGNLQPQPAPNQTMIHADAKCRDVIISDNIFNAKGKSVVIEAGARDIHAHDNRCSNPLTQPPPPPPR